MLRWHAHGELGLVYDLWRWGGGARMGELCPWTRSSLADIRILVGGAIPPVVPASTMISATLKRAGNTRGITREGAPRARPQKGGDKNPLEAVFCIGIRTKYGHNPHSECNSSLFFTVTRSVL